jgi:hypothetical protein
VVFAEWVFGEGANNVSVVKSGQDQQVGLIVNVAVEVCLAQLRLDLVEPIEQSSLHLTAHQIVLELLKQPVPLLSLRNDIRLRQEAGSRELSNEFLAEGHKLFGIAFTELDRCVVGYLSISVFHLMIKALQFL